MIDRTTKALLLAIAIGLWMNVATQWLRPVPVQAQTAQVARDVARIASDVNAIWGGICVNGKIC